MLCKVECCALEMLGEDLLFPDVGDVGNLAHAPKKGERTAQKELKLQEQERTKATEEEWRLQEQMKRQKEQLAAIDRLSAEIAQKSSRKEQRQQRRSGGCRNT